MTNLKPIELLDSKMDAWRILSDAQRELGTQQSCGANSVFVGRMRDSNQGQDVSEMFLEHYPGMTEKQLQNIAEQAAKTWPLQHYIIRHRYGAISPGEDIVVIATWSTHRQAAIESCQFIIEELKKKATFWKKEVLAADGSIRWVDSAR